MMEFSFGQWEETTAENLGIGFRSINIGDTRISGIEFSVTAGGKLGKDHLNILGGYTYIDAIPLNPEIPYGNDANDNQLNYYNTSSLDSNSLFLKYRHKHVAKLDFEYTRGIWSIGSSFRYNSFMLNIDKIFVSDFFESIVPGIPQSREDLSNGDFIIDSRIICKISDKVSSSIIINNLLNTEYQTRPSNMMAPRLASIKLGISL